MTSKRAAASAIQTTPTTLNLIGVNVQLVKERLLSSTVFETPSGLCRKMLDLIMSPSGEGSKQPVAQLSSMDIVSETTSQSNVLAAPHAIATQSASAGVEAVAPNNPTQHGAPDVPNISSTSVASTVFFASRAVQPARGLSAFTSSDAMSSQLAQISLSSVKKVDRAQGSSALLHPHLSLHSNKAATIEFTFTTGNSTRCDWCRLPIPNPELRLGVPVSYEYTHDGLHKFRMFGSVCRLECALAQARHDSMLPVQQRFGPRYYEHLVHLLHELSCNDSQLSPEASLSGTGDADADFKYKPNVLRAAPDWRLLQSNGGALTKEQFFSDIVHTKIRSSLLLETVAQVVTFKV